MTPAPPSRFALQEVVVKLGVRDKAPLGDPIMRSSAVAFLGKLATCGLLHLARRIIDLPDSSKHFAPGTGFARTFVTTRPPPNAPVCPPTAFFSQGDSSWTVFFPLL
jgi:hypothetical protein